jgi:hypothetical protein
MFGYKLKLGKFSSLERDETVYAPLRDGTSSPSEKGSEGDHEEISYARTTRKRPQRLFPFCVILLLFMTNIMTIASLVATRKLTGQLDAVEPEYTPKSAGKKVSRFSRQKLNLLARVENMPTKWKRFNWWTEYSDKNFTETDALWDDINPAHGFISVDRSWAKIQHWPDTMPMPEDSSKSVYLLEAYHLLHCVVSSQTVHLHKMFQS